jgi:hypothetical protein
MAVTAVFEENSDITITVEPEGGTYHTGASHPFLIEAEGGTPPLTYQWYRDSTPVSGAEDSQWTLNPLTADDSGSYYCVVTDALEATRTSRTVHLLAGDPLQVSANPEDAWKYTGEEHTFTVSASGTGTLSWQWYKDLEVIEGAEGPDLPLSDLATGDAGSYSCRVSDAIDTIYTDSAALAIAPAVAFSAQPRGTTIAEGQSLTLSAAAEGGFGTLTFAWFRDGAPLDGGKAVSEWQIADAGPEDAGAYVCVASDERGRHVHSQEAWIYVVSDSGLAITQQPRNAFAAIGGNHAFTIAAGGGIGALHYAWIGPDDTPLGSNSPQLTIHNIAQADFGPYYCTVSDNIMSVTSQTVYLAKVDSVPAAAAGGLALISLLISGRVPAAPKDTVSSGYPVTGRGKHDSTARFFCFRHSCTLITASASIKGGRNTKTAKRHSVPQSGFEIRRFDFAQGVVNIFGFLETHVLMNLEHAEPLVSVFRVRQWICRIRVAFIFRRGPGIAARAEDRAVLKPGFLREGPGVVCVEGDAFGPERGHEAIDIAAEFFDIQTADQKPERALGVVEAHVDMHRVERIAPVSSPTRDTAAALYDTGQFPQLHTPDSRAEIVKVEVERTADIRVPIRAERFAAIRSLTRLPVKRFIPGEYDTALRAGRMVLAGHGRKRRNIAEGAHGFSLIQRAMRLGAVFDDPDPLLPRPFQNGIHIHRQA